MVILPMAEFRGAENVEMNAPINEEMINDRAKLILHRIIARRIAWDPDLIKAARSQLSSNDKSPDFVRDWGELLDLDPFDLRRLLTSRSERMTRLRSSSPFSSILDFRDPAFRRRVWRIARKGAFPSD